MSLTFRELHRGDLAQLMRVEGGPAWQCSSIKWEKRMAERVAGDRIVFLAESEGGIIAYGSLLWRSNYAEFRSRGIPEINDMVVAEAYRKRGVATELIRAIEQKAAQAGHAQIGIGVGLYASYGAAQRLYVRLGFVPDGKGITYRDQFAPPGSMVTVDDELVLWFSKAIATIKPEI